MKQKTILTIELEHVRIITKKSARREFLCEICGTTNEFVGTTEAMKLAKLIGINSPEIFHFHQTTENKIFVCLNSIFENLNLD